MFGYAAVFLHTQIVCLFFCVVGWLLGSKEAANNLEVFGRWLITEILIRYHLNSQRDYNCLYFYFDSPGPTFQKIPHLT
jgi:hypothetical protein